MSPITTHVLDTSLGCPAAGITVVLYRVDQSGSTAGIGRGVTNADGRVTDLLSADETLSGVYRIAFDTASYFAQRGCKAFYPQIEIFFATEPGEAHYHVPLLLSPFGYSTYRGS